MANLRVDKITSTETFETTGSVQFDGVDDGLTISDNAAFDLGTGDFTIEGWYYLVNAGAYQSLMDWRGSGADGNYPALFRNNTGNYIYYYVNSVVRITNVEISYNTWFHVSICRFSGITKLFIDGKEKGSFTDTISYVSRDILLGVSQSNSNDLTGNISNYRVVKGRALYTSNFKPPMRELEVVPGTVLLACQSKTDASLEKTGKTITVNGNAVANELTPGILTPVVKSGGGSAITGSVEFDGTGDYLSVTPTDDFELGSDDFTIEAWVYSANWKASLANTIFSKGNSSSVSTEFYSFQAAQTTGRVQFFWRSGSALLDGSNTRNLSIDSWNHVAVTRSGDTFNLYINGILDDTTTSSTTLDTGVTGGVLIGAQSFDPTNNNRLLTGNISNLRVVKGTALYTDDFIPPTRELKRVPGTVLLCCQDPNNPLTEATGKTITPHGSLGDGSIGGELVTNNSVWTLTKGGSGATDWTVSNAGSSLAGTTVTSGYIRAEYTVPKGDYLVSLRWTGGNFGVQDSTGYIVATDGTGTEFGASEDGAYSFYMSDTTLIRIQGTSWSTAYTVDDISIKRIYKNNGASNFTPQVGDDRQVTFEGVTKINTENYFYFPTGDTASRTLNVATQASSSARGVFMGGLSSAPSGSVQDVMDYVTITSTGDAVDFGNLTAATRISSSCSSTTRGVRMGGFSDPATVDVIDYVTIASTGDSQDFGDLSISRHSIGGASNSVRGINFGDNSRRSLIEYITISTTGDSKDFGDMVDGLGQVTGTASPTRCVMAGGESPARINTMQYVTIMSMGNAFDFGDLTIARSGVVSLSSATRGLYLGGELPASPNFTNTVDFVQIATTGNAINFGDLDNSNGMRLGATAASPTRGLYAGGGNDQPISNTAFTKIHAFTIASTGDATDFGDITVARFQMNNGTVSSGHGGLG